MVAIINGSVINVLTGISTVYTRGSMGVARMARSVLRSVFYVVVVTSIDGYSIPFTSFSSSLSRCNGGDKLSVRIVGRSVFGSVREVWRCYGRRVGGVVGAFSVLRAVRVVRSRYLSVEAAAVNVSLLSYTSSSVSGTYTGICSGVYHETRHLISANRSVRGRCNVPVVGGHMSIAPVTVLTNVDNNSPIGCTLALRGTTRAVNIGFVNNCSTLIRGNFSTNSLRLVGSVPRTLTRARRLYSSMGVKSAGTNVGVSTIGVVNRGIGRTTRLAGSGSYVNTNGLIIFYGTPRSGPFVTNTFRNLSRPSYMVGINMSNPNIIETTVSGCPSCDVGRVTRLVGGATFGMAEVNRLINARTSGELNIPFKVISLSLTPAPTINSSITRVLRRVNIRRYKNPNAATYLTVLGSTMGGNNIVTSSDINNLSNTFVPISRSTNVVSTTEDNTLYVRGLRTVATIYSIKLSVVIVPNSAATRTVDNVVTSRTTVNVMGYGAATIHIVPTVNGGVNSRLRFNNLLNSNPIVGMGAGSPTGFVGENNGVPTPLRDLGG